MEEQHSCEEWSERLAARHFEDLSVQEHLALQEHLVSCLVCSAEYQTYQSLETKIRAVPTAAMPSSILPILQRKKQEMRSPLTAIEASRANPLTKHEEKITRQGRQLALLVGADIIAPSSLPPLHDTEEDVRRIAHTLQEYAFQVRYAVGLTATNYNIRIMFTQLANACRETDEVIIYLAGYCYKPQTAFENESASNGERSIQTSHNVVPQNIDWYERYLCTYDFNEPGVALSDGTSYISASLIRKILAEQVTARRVLLILDSFEEVSKLETSTHQDGMIRERLVEYFENSALHNGNHQGHLSKVASATSREFVSNEQKGEEIADVLRHALHSRAVATNLEESGVSNLQEVYRYLKQHT